MATKRFGAALEWITKVLAKTMVRQEPLLQTYAELGIISDASPWGVGAMLVFPSTGEPQVTILGGSSYERGSKDVGSGVWVLIFAGCDGDVCGFEVKSDSTVALAIVDRLSSPTKELN